MCLWIISISRAYSFSPSFNLHVDRNFSQICLIGLAVPLSVTSPLQCLVNCHSSAHSTLTQSTYQAVVIPWRNVCLVDLKLRSWHWSTFILNDWEALSSWDTQKIEFLEPPMGVGPITFQKLYLLDALTTALWWWLVVSNVLFLALIMRDATPVASSENIFLSISTWEHFSIIYTQSKSPIHIAFILWHQIVAPDFNFFYSFALVLTKISNNCF